MRYFLIKTLAASLSIAATAAVIIPMASRADTAPAPATASANLTVTFTGMTTPDGTLMVAVFDSEAAYSGKGAPVRATMAPASGSPVQVRFEGLAPGRYAIKAFHDVNGDGKLNANPFGIPTEPYAFSNGAQAHMGPPPFAEAAFDVAAGANTQSIVIQ